MAKNEKLLKLTAPADAIRAELELNLHPDYTFENFVVGKANKMAHAASLAVAEFPGKAYNPLYIWGDSGFGKTYLLNAIANRALELNPNLNIICLSAEKFVNKFFRAVQDEKLPQFQKELGGADMLLVDDVQFLEGKDQSQEKFLEIFDILRKNGRQIVLASDRMPSDFEDMSEGLVHRFCYGLVADIQKPGKALRAAILKKRAELKKISVPDDVIQFLAQKIKSDLWELGRALDRIIVNSEVQRQPITVENAAEWIKGA